MRNQRRVLDILGRCQPRIPLRFWPPIRPSINRRMRSSSSIGGYRDWLLLSLSLTDGSSRHSRLQYAYWHQTVPDDSTWQAEERAVAAVSRGDFMIVHTVRPPVGSFWPYCNSDTGSAASVVQFQLAGANQTLHKDSDQPSDPQKIAACGPDCPWGVTWISSVCSQV